MVHSRRKGNKGELEVAKLLKAWWRQLEPKALFVRTPLSGGLQYGHEFDASGDLMTAHAKRFPFSVEVKREEGWSFDVMLSGKPSPVWRFWRQCQRDAAKVNREPMLWFRKSRQPWLVLLRYEFVTGTKGVQAPDVVWHRSRLSLIDCEAAPVLYLGERVLQHAPDVFALTRS